MALSAIDARGNLAGSLISDVVVQDDLELVETLEERFRAATAGTFRALEYARGPDSGANSGKRWRRSTRWGSAGRGRSRRGASTLAELRNQLAFLARNTTITDSMEDAVVEPDRRTPGGSRSRHRAIGGPP